MAAALATYRDTKISLRSARLLPPACACLQKHYQHKTNSKAFVGNWEIEC